jgi:hypothetical protein
MLFPRLKAIDVSRLMIPDTEHITDLGNKVADTSASFLSIPFSGGDQAWVHSSHPPCVHRKKLTNITTLHSPWKTHCSKLFDDFLLWSPLFPNLNTLEITFPWSIILASHKLANVEKIIAKCPQIQVMVYNGTGGTIEDWRSGKQHRLTSVRDCTDWDEKRFV